MVTRIKNNRSFGSDLRGRTPQSTPAYCGSGVRLAFAIAQLWQLHGKHVDQQHEGDERKNENRQHDEDGLHGTFIRQVSKFAGNPE